MDIPNHLTGKALFDYLTKNKNKIIAGKMASIKHSDPTGTIAKPKKEDER